MLIQISTPIAQSPPVESFLPESRFLSESIIPLENGSAITVALDDEAHKNTKPGIFAKLLEGLHAKHNAERKPDEGGLVEAAGLEISEKTGADPEKAGINTLTSGLITKKTEDAAEIFDEEGGFPAISALFGQFEEPDSDLTGSVERRLTRKARETPEVNPLDGELAGSFVSSLSGGLDGENRAAGISADRAEKDEPSAEIPQPGKAKREDAERFLTRDAEALEKPRQGQNVQFRTDGAERGNSLFEKQLSEKQPSEVRGKKGRDRLTVEVRDLRTGSELSSRETDAAGGGTPGVVKAAAAEIEIPVNLRLTAGEAAAGGKAGGEGSIGRGFEDLLARELQGELSTDIVRSAMVIVRNGGEGTIRLSLRPASLGDVKIRIEMAENKITGHIIVESKEALRAFERELPVLEKAFKDSGFSETNLEMSLAQDGWDFGSQGQRQEEDFQALSSVLAASRYEADSGVMETPDLAGIVFPALAGRTSVNMFV